MIQGGEKVQEAQEQEILWEDSEPIDLTVKADSLRKWQQRCLERQADDNKDLKHLTEAWTSSYKFQRETKSSREGGDMTRTGF